MIIIKMAKIRCGKLVLESKLNNLLSTIANGEKDLESLKIDFNNVKSEHMKSTKGLHYLKNIFDMSRKESLLVTDRHIVLSDETLLARNEIYNNKRENHIIKIDTLTIINECNVLKSMIRKDVILVKSIRNKLYNARKGIGTFKVNAQICRNKRVNVITKQIYKNNEKINAINIKSAKLYKESANSTKIFELNRLKSEIKTC